MSALYGAIEAGGTKFVCAVGHGPNEILEEVRFPTTNPKDTLQKTIQFFKEQEEKRKQKISAMGIGSFGPLDPVLTSDTYGYITSTPKKGWQNTDFIGTMKEHFPIPMVFDTDVNGAALGEGEWGAAKGCHNFIYLTIGTGIGGGIVIDGKPLQGLIHPEVGHMLITKADNDNYKGTCPFHENCWEGLAAGPALEGRWNMPGKDLPSDHEAWNLEAEYIAQGLTNLLMILSPEKIILGGGVMHQRHLFTKVRELVKKKAADYISHPHLKGDLSNWIVPPQLEDLAGITGAFILALRASQ
ncbi:ROK family protein [Spirochaeta cellobiosiphila]|uniref:ROK family protein n=1 Tax=Spirochaeta cellobiosiphila TaxID=504483 RepID=UPI00040B2C81|nr:ROK family protein [Spirochaeta cellobiosiphila]